MSHSSDKNKQPINMDELDQMINDSIKEPEATIPRPSLGDATEGPSSPGSNPGPESQSSPGPTSPGARPGTEPESPNDKRPSEEDPDPSDPKRLKQENIEMELERAIETHNKEMENHKQDDNSGDHQPDPTRKTVIHQGISIPADSELLNSHSAFTAYSELSSHMPPLPATTNNHLASLPLAITAAEYLPPRIQLLVNTLPVLDNLATQILRTFTSLPYQQIIDLVSSAETSQGAVFTDLTSLFEFTKRLYSEDDPFLSVTHIAPGIWRDNERAPAFFKSREQSIESTLRKVNLSTFLLATLGVIEVGFFYLNELFLNIFCPLNNLDPENSLSNNNENNSRIQGSSEHPVGDKIGKLLKPQAILLLDLKTQAYISAVEAGERSREEILGDIFPNDLEQILLEKRDVRTLSPTEHDFIERCRGRKNTLLNYPDNSTLSEDYEWFQFLKSIFDFISKNMVFLIWGSKKKPLSTFHTNLNAMSDFRTETHTPQRSPTFDSSNNNEKENGSQSEKPGSPEYSDGLLPSEILEQQLHGGMANKSANRLSNRRPWTREEEKALRHALELKGPHWSSILELFGAGGKISEALKNRTQVQLKDKARNWKRFFLKSDLPVPQYLQNVTGDIDSEKMRRAKRNAAAPVPDLPKPNEL